MTLKVWCARCGEAYRVARDGAASHAQCLVCGHVQAIPAAGDYPLSEPPPPSEEVVPPAREAPSGPPPAAVAAPSSRPGAGRTGRDPSRLHGFAVALVGLSMADLFMTHLLMRTSRVFYEGNPVARWFFDRWNMAGMVAFKFSVIGGVIALAEYIERRRPGWGKAVMLVGCVAATYAVLHGLRLFAGFGGEPVGEED